MECIILQGKCCLDIGQPRRGWLTYRRGLALAQLTVSMSESFTELMLRKPRIYTATTLPSSAKAYGGHFIMATVS